ncbi:MAG: hypothetical protein VX694_17240, partial [Planctomycetota bacterium]|nr:hypothetical protein [Planctomycetota bacterium]
PAKSWSVEASKYGVRAAFRKPKDKEDLQLTDVFTSGLDSFQCPQPVSPLQGHSRDSPQPL